MGNSYSNPLQSLEPGDKVCFKRKGYKHYGIYKGDKQVTHLTGQQEGGLAANSQSIHLCSISGVGDAKCVIRIDNIHDVANGCTFYKDNGRDRFWRPLDKKTISDRAMKYVGQVVKYNLFNSNCEHLANWCRYGQYESDQANDATIGTACGLSYALLGAGGFLGAFLYFATRRDKQKVKK